MVAPEKRPRDEFQAFYTNCNFITSYMASLLNLSDEHSLLEPCAGEGAFIDQLLSDGFKGSIKANELNSASVKQLLLKYSAIANVDVELDDFVFQITSDKYDRIIANPPMEHTSQQKSASSSKKCFQLSMPRKHMECFLSNR